VVALLVAGACSGKKSGPTGLAARATTTTESTAPADTVASDAPPAGATTTIVKVSTTVTTVPGGHSTATTAAPAHATTTAAAVATTTANAATQTVHATGPPDYGFSPATFSVAAGSKVVVANDSQVAPHTWTADDGSFDTGTIDPGAKSAAITLTKKGTFGFYCKIHGAALMHGTVTVT
jgi:plastocyanin